MRKGRRRRAKLENIPIPARILERTRKRLRTIGKEK